MSLATWWVNDPLPALPALHNFVVRQATTDEELVARGAESYLSC
jgi:hypothetical protein